MENTKASYNTDAKKRQATKYKLDEPYGLFRNHEAKIKKSLIWNVDPKKISPERYKLSDPKSVYFEHVRQVKRS